MSKSASITLVPAARIADSGEAEGGRNDSDVPPTRPRRSIRSPSRHAATRRSPEAERGHTRTLTATRVLGAVALLIVGGVHFQQYAYAFYSNIPTIGSLFLANFFAAAALGLFLLAPIRSPLGSVGKLMDQAAALMGAGVAAGGLAGLLISEHTELFGFMEHGYRFAIVLAIASEAVAIATLTAFAARMRAGARSPGVTRGRDRSAVSATADNPAPV